MQNRRAFLKTAAAVGLTLPIAGRTEILLTLDPGGSIQHPSTPSIRFRPITSPRKEGLAWLAKRGSQKFFLVGTLHALAAPDYPLPRLIDTCYSQSSDLLMEFSPYEHHQPEARKLVRAKGLLTKVGGLLDLIPEDTKQLLRKFLATRPGFTFLLDCKPWLAAQWIQQALAAECGLEGVHGVESYLSRRTNADRKPIQLLETQTDALKALDGVPLTAQIESLQLTLLLAEQGKYRALFNTIRRAWKMGDEDQLNALFAATTDDSRAYRKSIIENRNQNWLDRIKVLKASGAVMIAAGTQHFCGENSLPLLLKAEGFSVSRVI